MLTRILVPLLIVAIQACPFCCASATLASVNRDPSKSSCCGGCCCSHQQDVNHQSQGLPRRSAPSPIGPGFQCVCSGAVVDRAKPFELRVERPLDDVVATVPLAAILPSHASFSIHSPAQHVRTTPGRLVRCLHMSFLC